MLYYDPIDISEDINIDKCNDSHDCKILSLQVLV